MKKQALWAIQKNLINDDDAKDMTDALDSIQRPYELLQVIPFSQQIPYIKHDGPIIPYGGTNFIDKISKRKEWCCWFNENFTYKTALDKYGQHMLNNDAKFMRIGDFSPSMFDDQLLFIRPDKDLKEFTGDIFDKNEFHSWCASIQKQGYDVDEKTNILVASASKVDVEWRIFVVNNEPISGSQYRVAHMLKKSSTIPSKVYKFVKEMCTIWTPSDVFVMDICQVNNDLAIMEIGDFHSAGWYLSDKTKIMEAISIFAEKKCRR